MVELLDLEVELTRSCNVRKVNQVAWDGTGIGVTIRNVAFNTLACFLIVWLFFFEFAVKKFLV